MLRNNCFVWIDDGDLGGKGGKRGSNYFHSHAAKSYLKARTDSSIIKMIENSEIHDTGFHCSFAIILSHFGVAKAEEGLSCGHYSRRGPDRATAQIGHGTRRTLSSQSGFNPRVL